MKANELYKKHEQIKEITSLKNTTGLALGELLYEMKKDDRYKTISGEETSFSQYLADPEVKIAESSAYRYISTYKRYIVELGCELSEINGLDIHKLYNVRKVITKENKDEWLGNIRSLSRSDLFRLLNYPDIDPMECEHETKPHKNICVKCGEVFSVKK